MSVFVGKDRACSSIQSDQRSYFQQFRKQCSGFAPFSNCLFFRDFFLNYGLYIRNPESGSHTRASIFTSTSEPFHEKCIKWLLLSVICWDSAFPLSLRCILILKYLLQTVMQRQECYSFAPEWSGRLLNLCQYRCECDGGVCCVQLLLLLELQSITPW